MKSSIIEAAWAAAVLGMLGASSWAIARELRSRRGVEAPGPGEAPSPAAGDGASESDPEAHAAPRHQFPPEIPCPTTRSPSRA